VLAGLEDLDARARTIDGRADFAALSGVQQIGIMRAIEHEPFFALARVLVVLGMFADPMYGGNKGGVGWAMLGFDHRPTHVAPFGWYDAQERAESGKGAR
jgi:gluconate 2-dehydrogenase gamma chain